MTQNNEIERPLREEIAEIKQTLKAMQADIEIIKRYNGGVYDYDIAEEPPYIPTHACSLEDQLAATKRYQEYCQRHPEFVCGPAVTGEYLCK